MNDEEFIKCLMEEIDELENYSEKLRSEISHKEFENEKLRELVLILLTCASDLDECDKCPINGGTGVWDFEDFCDGLLDRVHELGIEVDS